MSKEAYNLLCGGKDNESERLDGCKVANHPAVSGEELKVEMLVPK